MTRHLPLQFLLISTLRLAIWLLLTADLDPVNVGIGLALALLLPRARSRPLPPGELLVALGRTLIAIPRAWFEALALLLARDPVEREVLQPAGDRAVPLLVFLEVFRITLTPFTIALGLEPDGRHYRIHELLPRRFARRRGEGVDA